jgi:ABC-type phosphate transport system substrate-binding protein
VKILNLNGVEPSNENILHGHYILGRPLYIVTPKNRSDELNRFLWYAKSPKGQKIIEEQGVIPESQSGDMLRRYRLLMQNIKGSKKGAFE